MALAALWLLGRAGSALTLFERLALLASIAAALTAIRQVVWFELTAAALLPVLVTAWRGKPAEAAAPRWVGRFAAAGIVLTAVALLSARPGWFESHLPTGAQAAIV